MKRRNLNADLARFRESLRALVNYLNQPTPPTDAGSGARPARDSGLGVPVPVPQPATPRRPSRE